MEHCRVVPQIAAEKQYPHPFFQSGPHAALLALGQPPPTRPGPLITVRRRHFPGTQALTPGCVFQSAGFDWLNLGGPALETGSSF